MICRALAALALILTGCVTHEDGTWVAVGIADRSSAESTFTHEALTLGVEDITLVACPSLAARVLRALSPIRVALSPVGVAYAHEWDRSSSFDARTESMEAGAPERTLAILSPAAGRYCGVRIGLAATGDSPALGVRGRLEESVVDVATNLHLDLEHDFDAPLVLEDGALAATITVVLDANRWLEGVTDEALAAGGLPLERQLVENVRRTLRVTVR